MLNQPKLGRDPARIRPFLEKLEKIWTQDKIDQQRFGQLIENLMFTQKGPNRIGLWTLEDKDFEKLLDNWIESHK